MTSTWTVDCRQVSEAQIDHGRYIKALLCHWNKIRTKFSASFRPYYGVSLPINVVLNPATWKLIANSSYLRTAVCVQGWQQCVSRVGARGGGQQYAYRGGVTYGPLADLEEPETLFAGIQIKKVIFGKKKKKRFVCDCFFGVVCFCSLQQ